MEIHISFVAEKILSIGSFAVSNSLFSAVVMTVLLAVFIIIARSKLKSFKPKGLEITLELMYTTLAKLVEDIMGKKNADKFIGFLLTFFFMILVFNLFGLLPFVPSLGILKPKEPAAITQTTEVQPPAETETSQFVHSANASCLISGKCFISTQGIVENAEFTPIFRAPTADLSNAITFALISVIVTNIVGFRALGLKYLKKYFDISNPINLFVSILEGVSELSKVISFSFRLFGNIFAGEVLLSVITALTFGIGTLPFFGLELLVGTIQALVFFMLTAVFISLAVEQHH
jgi:F-type H+-transporting ATPase subunit a